MHHIFFNPQERRARAFFRIVAFLVFCIIAAGVASMLAWQWASMLVTAFLILLFYFIFITYIDNRPWSESGIIVNWEWTKEFLVGSGIATAVMALIFITEWSSGNIDFIAFSWDRTEDLSWLLSFLGFFIVMLCVGFYEELLMRGYLIPNLTEGFTIGNIKPVQALILAIIISSSIFGFAHAANPNSTLFAVVNIVLAGLMLAVPYVITGRLALSIGIHFAWNFAQGGIFGFPVSGMGGRQSLIYIKQNGPEWWTGGAFGPEGGVIGILGVLLILGLSIFYLKRKGVPMGFASNFVERFPKES